MHQKLKGKSLQHRHPLLKEVLSVQLNPPSLDPKHINKNCEELENPESTKKWIILYRKPNTLDLKWHANNKLCSKRLVQKFWHLELGKQEVRYFRSPPFGILRYLMGVEIRRVFLIAPLIDPRKLT